MRMVITRATINMADMTDMTRNKMIITWPKIMQTREENMDTTKMMTLTIRR